MTENQTIRSARSTPTAGSRQGSQTAPALDLDPTRWKAIVARFQTPDVGRASWQIVNSIGAYLAVWVLMYFCVEVSWWLVIPLAMLAGGLLVRVFIIFHDCGHGSFFASRTANSFWGVLTGLLTMTPYLHWRAEHAIHHGTTGDLDKRGIGDIWTMTVKEYLDSSRWKKIGYRFLRNPIVLFVVAPIVLLLVIQRFSRKGADRRERFSVWSMNVAIVGMIAGLIAIFGWLPYLIIQGTVLLVAGSAGLWLFYLQHQFEDAYWERGADWDYAEAALKGSSFYKLPRVLQWFSGNIGFHHIHHLSPRIPNYNLEACHLSDPMFEAVKPLTFWSAWSTMELRLWDEASKKLVGWSHLRGLRKTAAA